MIKMTEINCQGSIIIINQPYFIHCFHDAYGCQDTTLLELIWYNIYLLHTARHDLILTYNKQNNNAKSVLKSTNKCTMQSIWLDRNTSSDYSQFCHLLALVILGLRQFSGWGWCPYRCRRGVRTSKSHQSSRPVKEKGKGDQNNNCIFEISYLQQKSIMKTRSPHNQRRWGDISI
jgi:hypothetical protein